MLDLALCFHHAVVGDDNAVTDSITRLRDLTRGGDHAYYVDIAHYTTNRTVEASSPAPWLDVTKPSDPNGAHWPPGTGATR
ncbi:hypothetical protein ACFU5O_35405 [Streptomyces sp. NPDC057445]|uniref:hypothetical protein n=1 Tax=Streptomyces sp. NPDC057445 TaxID=3346136 RepID=UPI00369D5C9E